MSWEATRWQIPLDRPPRIVQMGVGHHGQRAVEHYRLPQLWCVHIYRYVGELQINGASFPIRHGYASVTPPNSTLEYHYRGASVHVYAHFALPNVKKNVVTIPAMQDLGKRFLELDAQFQEAVGWFSTQPARAAARVWDVLWQLTVRVRRETPNPVRFVQEEIERKLATPLYVPDLARSVNLSHNHLTRLFRQTTKLTVVDYIRQRRIQRARHLLEHTTLPIKAIAAEVGLADLHLFNKVIRRALGRPPRAVRG